MIVRLSSPGTLPEPPSPLLSISGLAVRFGPLRALEGVDLVVRPGELIALAGENGAGKTTLVRCIAGDIKPTSGEIMFGGRPAPRDPRGVARQGVADTAETANDDVIVKLAELRVHGAETKYLVELIERDELHQSAGEEDHAGAAKHDRDDGDTSQQRGVDRVDLAISHRINRHDHHIKSVTWAPARQPVSDRGEHNHGENEAGAKHQVTCR